MALLEVTGLGINFGGLQALSDVSLSIDQNELVGLIGPNGSGKTTTFNLLSGVYVPSEGDIVFDGKRMIGKKPHEINRAGIARTFQNIRLFKGLTVIENVKTALHATMTYTTIEGMFRLPSYWKQEKAVHLRAIELLEVFGMADLAGHSADHLPYGQQRQLEIARALATNPKILMLDEPAAGMNPSETKSLMETIRLIIEKFHVGVLLIEHDMNLVMGICERLIVLDYGNVIARGLPGEIKENPRVIDAYLGG